MKTATGKDPRMDRLERIVLAVAKKSGVALNWETLDDLDRRLKELARESAAAHHRRMEDNALGK